mgnify:CR=1 FL=1|jgi:mRNA-degrading endonuclease toxin of MazEF toxin-antitoxin module
MSSGTTTNIQYEAREILLANITFPNQVPKNRPIIVISKFSSIMFQPPSDILICLAVTSSITTNPYMIQIKNSDLEENRFPKPSQVVCDNIFTIMKSDVIKKIGKVTPEFYKHVTDLIKKNILEIG